MEQAVIHTNRLLQKAKLNDAADIVDALISTCGLNMQSFYTSAENILYDIARVIDGDVPNGKSWHSELLEQMALPLPEIRDVVISHKALALLDELRRFRHVVRSHYSFDLEHDRVKELSRQLGECMEVLKTDLKNFLLSLEQT
ncbi:MAG: hypothetical protein ACFB14_24145 [Leptolyngbyaceae cyanobacterium]